MVVLHNDRGYARLGRVQGSGHDPYGRRFWLVGGKAVYEEDILRTRLSGPQVALLCWEAREAGGRLEPWEALAYLEH